MIMKKLDSTIFTTWFESVEQAVWNDELLKQLKPYETAGFVYIN